MKRILLLVLLAAFSTTTHSFNQCSLTLDQAKRQGSEASRHLTIISENYVAAVTYHQSNNTAGALQSIVTTETSLYQARNYYVLALFQIDQAAKVCSSSVENQINRLQGVWQKELGTLDELEDKVFDLKDIILKI